MEIKEIPVEKLKIGENTESQNNSKWTRKMPLS